MDEKQRRIAKLREVNAILIKNALAHHPNCADYDHHVLTVRNWRFCLGCTAMYSVFVLLIIIEIVWLIQLSINPWFRLAAGLLLFLPALVQLKLKTDHRAIRFSLRALLGASIFFLLSFIFYIQSYLIKILALIIFVMGVRTYSHHQGSRQLRECETCSFGEPGYHQCMTKYGELLQVENLELISDTMPQVEQMLSIQRARESGELVDLQMTTSKRSDEPESQQT